MMEFCAFSFPPFNRDATVNSLDEFLSYYDQEDLLCFFPTSLHKISSDTTKAIQYINSNNWVHRDIKPANILVSNIHYNNLTDAQNTANILKRELITCKLAGLGEVRSKLLQTRVISNNSRTHDFWNFGWGDNFKISRNRTINVWALAITFIVILNPDQKSPFQCDLEKRTASDVGLHVSDSLRYFLRKKAMSSFTQKYEEILASCYSKCRYVFFKYIEFNASERATVNEVIEKLTKEY